MRDKAERSSKKQEKRMEEIPSRGKRKNVGGKQKEIR